MIWPMKVYESVSRDLQLTFVSDMKDCWTTQCRKKQGCGSVGVCGAEREVTGSCVRFLFTTERYSTIVSSCDATYYKAIWMVTLPDSVPTVT